MISKETLFNHFNNKSMKNKDPESVFADGRQKRHFFVWNDTEQDNDPTGCKE